MSEMMRLGGWLPLAALLPGALVAQTPTAQTARTNQIVEVAVSMSDEAADLSLELADGRSLRVRLADGRIYVGGDEVARYEAGGAFERAWRDLLRRAAEGEFEAAWPGFAAGEYGGADASAARATRSAIEAGLGSFPAPVADAAPADREAAVATALTAATAAAETDQEATPQEVVSGGLVVELTELEGLTRSLSRIGLTSRLSRGINGALAPPMRIVLEADEYRLPEGARLETSLWLVETDGVLAGTVAGNVFVADGTLLIAPTAVIEGDLVTADAEVENMGGKILGEVRDLEAAISPIVVPPAPRAVETSRPPAILRGLSTIMHSVAAYIMLALVGALLVYFLRGHLEIVSDTVSYSFGRSFLAGLVAQILFLPVLLVMVVLVLTWIVIPVYLVGFVLALLLGYLAVAHAAGENLTRRRYSSWTARMRRSNSYYYVLNGLAVLLGFFAAAGVAEMGGAILVWAYGLLIAAAVILTWVASTAGLGAALLSRGGTQRAYARPHELPDLPIELPVDSLDEEMEIMRRRTEAARRDPRAREKGDEG